MSLTNCPPAPRGTNTTRPPRPPQRTLSELAEFELAEDFLPVYDVSDAVATVADADRETVWGALLDVELREGDLHEASRSAEQPDAGC